MVITKERRRAKLWLRKKVILIPLVVALVVVGSITGIALAQSGSDSSENTLLARVATILGIDQTKVEDAFAQAQKEMRDEALDSYLKDMVDQSKITQEQADQYKTWWDARPDALDKIEPRFGFGGRGGGFHGCGGPWMPPAQPTPSTDSTQ
jgi:hypothetical protein